MDAHLVGEGKVGDVGVGEPELYLSAAAAVEAGNHACIVQISRMIWLERERHLAS